MLVICDAPGQTCNRLWTYVASVAQCVAERRRMVILFYDWTIEDFPSLLHCPFIYYPLYHPWFLRLPKGWGWYKSLTWKTTHSRFFDRVFAALGFTKGWQTRTDTRYLRATLPELKRLFRPADHIMARAEAMTARLRAEADMVVGVHVRRGDYATWNDGRFFFSLDDYRQFMRRVEQCYAPRRVAFFISSNEDFSPADVFAPCHCQRFAGEPAAALLDLYTLSLCDRIIGPYSTYSRWASFIGEVPLCFCASREQQFDDESFSKIVDYFHFESGLTIDDW